MNASCVNLFLLLWGLSGVGAAAQGTNCTIRVVGTNGQPLRCECKLWLQSAAGKKVHIGNTMKGVRVVSSAYVTGDRIEVEPDDRFYYLTPDETDCPLQAITIITVSQAPVTARTIDVIDDAGSPVLADVWIEFEAGGKKLIATTAHGKFVVSEVLSRKDVIRVVPKAGTQYLEDARVRDWVTTGKEIKITSTGVWSNLQKAADNAEGKGKSGEAAMIYQELSVRAMGFDPNLAKRYEGNCYKMLGDYFQVDEPSMLGNSGKHFMSIELGSEVKAFQVKKGLKADGLLDYTTMQKIGGVPIGKYLKD